MQTRQLRSTEATMTPEQTIITANQLAYRSSPDAPLRALAAEIVGNTPNVRRDAPPRIAAWVRDNIRYFQESPGIETLQGPYTTLPSGLRVGSFAFTGTGVGDCDDLSILFATLCRAIGLNAYVCGIAPYPYDGIGFIHAVGYCADDRNFYELSKDEAYGGIPNKPLAFKAPPVGMCGLYFCPVDGIFRCLTNDPDAPAPSYDASQGYYNQSRADAPWPALPARPRASSPGVIMGTSMGYGYRQYGQSGLVVPSRYAMVGGMGATTGKGTAGRSTTNEVMASFTGKQSVSPGEKPQPNTPRAREVLGESLGQIAPFLQGLGMNPDTFLGANAASGGASGALALLQTGINIGLNEAGAGAEAYNVANTALMAGQMCLSAPSPVTYAVAAVMFSASILKATLVTLDANRDQERYGRQIGDLTYEMVEMSLGLRKGQTASVDDAGKALLMFYRMLECNAILSSTYGTKKSGYRGRVKIGLYENWPNRIGSGEQSGFVTLRNYGQGTYAARKTIEEKGVAFFDGTTSAKGMNWVGGDNLTTPKRILGYQKEVTKRARDIMVAVGLESGFTAEALQRLHLGTFWSLLAQVITLQTTTTVQSEHADGGTQAGITRQQRAIPITQQVFWNAFGPTFGQTPEDCVLPVAAFFGATTDELLRGEFAKSLSEYGFGNFDIFEQAAAASEQTSGDAGGGWDFPGGGGGSETGRRTGGGLIALAAAAGGAFLLSRGGV